MQIQTSRARRKPITIPARGRGRPSPAAQARYDRDLRAFCVAVLEIASTLEFKVSSRGWCYLLEEHGLGKGDFGAAQRLINDARKSGLLPIDICAEDGGRLPDGLEEITDETPEEYARGWIDALDTAHEHYESVSFWDFQDYYIEMVVEKIDLKSLFLPVCNEFHVSIANARGWADINSRAKRMARFAERETEGKQCVLLYCGDHDPAGLNISDSLMSMLEEMQGAVGWNPAGLIIERFGLNADFIRDNNLTWIEGLERGSGDDLADPRHKDHNKPYVQNYLERFGARKVEANALVTRAAQGRQLCRDAIEPYINRSGIHEYELALVDGREAARREIAALRRAS